MVAYGSQEIQPVENLLLIKHNACMTTLRYNEVTMKNQKISHFFPALSDSDTLKFSSIEPSQYLDGRPLDLEAQIISNGFFLCFSIH